MERQATDAWLKLASDKGVVNTVQFSDHEMCFQESLDNKLHKKVWLTYHCKRFANLIIADKDKVLASLGESQFDRDYSARRVRLHYIFSTAFPYW